MQITRRAYINFVIAGNSNNVHFEQWELESANRPRFGRNWWFWLPEFNNNGGRFKANKNTDLGVLWLCFSLSLTVYAG